MRRRYRLKYSALPLGAALTVVILGLLLMAGWLPASARPIDLRGIGTRRHGRVSGSRSPAWSGAARSRSPPARVRWCARHHGGCRRRAGTPGGVRRPRRRRSDGAGCRRQRARDVAGGEHHRLSPAVRARDLLAQRNPGASWSLGVGVLALAVLGIAGRLLELHTTFVGMMLPLVGRELRVSSASDRARPWSARAVHAPTSPPAIRRTRSARPASSRRSFLAIARRPPARRARAGGRDDGGRVARRARRRSSRSVSRALEHVADEWNAAGRLPAAQWRYQSRARPRAARRPAHRRVDRRRVRRRLRRRPAAGEPEAARRTEPAPPVDEDARRALARARDDAYAPSRRRPSPSIRASRGSVSRARSSATACPTVSSPPSSSSTRCSTTCWRPAFTTTSSPCTRATGRSTDRGAKGGTRAVLVLSVRTRSIFPAAGSWEFAVRPSAELRGDDRDAAFPR